MKWTGMAAVALVLAVSGLATAIEPSPATIRMPNTRGPLYSAANWWARYGEPVNQAAIDAGPAEPEVVPAGWAHHGAGYVYGPGSCDYTHACTDWQWADYNPMPWRCNPHRGHWLHGRCGHCGHGCDACGKGDCGCAVAAPDCAAKVPTCEAAPACEAAPTCEAVPSCGCDVATACCKKKHFHWHWKGCGFWHKNCGCDTCAPSCGCEPACGVEAPLIEKGGPEQAPPKPIADETKAAAFAWPLGPVR